MNMPKTLFDGPIDAAVTVALAHGAGLPMDAPFMTEIAAALAARGHRVARFEFPYMAKRRDTGKKGPPDRAPVLLETWRVVVDHIGRENLVVAGKSLGGRMAAAIAHMLEQEKVPVRGCVCLGFPFHPPGKPDRLRLDDISEIATPTLIVQGTRDPFGTKDEVPGYELSAAVRVHWLDDGDHSFVPRKLSGRTAKENMAAAVEAVDGFISNLGGR